MLQNAAWLDVHLAGASPSTSKGLLAAVAGARRGRHLAHGLPDHPQYGAPPGISVRPAACLACEPPLSCSGKPDASGHATQVAGCIDRCAASGQPPPRRASALHGGLGSSLPHVVTVQQCACKGSICLPVVQAWAGVILICARPFQVRHSGAASATAAAAHFHAEPGIVLPDRARQRQRRRVAVDLRAPRRRRVCLVRRAPGRCSGGAGACQSDMCCLGAQADDWATATTLTARAQYRLPLRRGSQQGISRAALSLSWQPQQAPLGSPLPACRRARRLAPLRAAPRSAPSGRPPARAQHRRQGLHQRRGRG